MTSEEPMRISMQQRSNRTVSTLRGLRMALLLWTVAVILPLVAPAQVSDDAQVSDAAGALDAGAPEDAAVPFFESLDIQVVNVDVYVTDRSGEAVAGLTSDDFELLVDGRPMEISNFYAVDGQVPARRMEPSPETLAAPSDGQATDLPSVQSLPEEQRLHLVIYFDNLFLKPFNRNKVTRQVRNFLSHNLSPEDRVMLVTFERSLHVRQPFTDNRQAVADQLFGIEELTGFASQADAARQSTLRNIRSAKTFSEAEPFVDFYAKQLFNDLELSIDALKEIVGSLAGLPGRKAVLYVSDGLPMKAGADLYASLDQRFTHGASAGLLANRYSVRSSFRELISTANSNRVSFYTLEALGVRSHASLSAEHSGDQGSQIDLDIERSFNNQETLQMLAADTGGLAAFNTNNIAGALQRMGSDFSSYYSLGFVPRQGGDGRAHSIDVRLRDDKGLQLRHRGSYRAKGPESRLMDRVQASLHHGWQANPMAADLQLAPPRRGDGRNLLVPVTVTVPFNRVTLLPRGAHHTGQLRLVVAVIDDDGKTSIPQVEILPLSIPDEHLEAVLQQDIHYSAEVMVNRGTRHLTVGLRDEVSGEVAVLRRAVE